MADTKISALTAVTDIQSTDDFVLARAGATKRITGASLATVGSPGDKPPGTPNALDDEFDDSSFTGWTWRNQGSATADETTYPGALVLTAPASASTSLRIIEKTAPSTPYTITAKSTWTPQPVNFHGAGLALINNSNGKVVSFQSQWAATPAHNRQIIRYTNATTFSAVGGLNTGYPDYGVCYYRVANNGTTLTMSFSSDGMTWLQIGTETIATFITTIDRIGLFADTESGSFPLSIAWHWFRVT